jgi:hypothetical protein
MTTPADLFRATGEALFGEKWKSELGRRLGVHERQIRRWAYGEYDPPPGVWAELAAMIAERRQTLAELARPVTKAANAV